MYQEIWSKITFLSRSNVINANWRSANNELRKSHFALCSISKLPEFVSLQHTFAWQGAMCALHPPEAHSAGGRANLIADCISDSGHERACLPPHWGINLGAAPLRQREKSHLTTRRGGSRSRRVQTMRTRCFGWRDMRNVSQYGRTRSRQQIGLCALMRGLN
jgi:hypothetical protein